MADCGTCTKQRGTYIPDFINAPPNQMVQKSDKIKKKSKHEWGRRAEAAEKCPTRDVAAEKIPTRDASPPLERNFLA